MASMVRAGAHAVIVQYCAMTGRLETPVRRFSVLAVASYAQYPYSVTVEFRERGKPRPTFFTVLPDDTRYLTIEVAGQEVYDSRADVPCDMTIWQRTAERSASQPVVSDHHS